MPSDIVNLAALAVSGAAIGFALLQASTHSTNKLLAHQVTDENSSSHLFLIVFFGLCTLITAVSGDHLNASVSAILTALTLVATKVAVSKRMTCNLR
jgi:uncharacterized membrane protein YjfL (UPF0719 family)